MKKPGQCYFLTYVRPPKKFGLIFFILSPFLGTYPPVCGFITKISMYNSNTDSLELILGVEVFFSWSLFRSTVHRMSS